MKDTRVIRIIGDIDEESFLAFSESLSEFESNNKSKRVVLELHSAGGNAYDALAFCARMRLSPCPIHVIAYGYVASAAVLVLASGCRRLMCREGWVMVHEDSGSVKGDVVTMERESNQYRKLETQWNILLENRTTASASDWENMHKRTTYLTPSDCLELGLVDKLI